MNVHKMNVHKAVATGTLALSLAATGSVSGLAGSAHASTRTAGSSVTSAPGRTTVVDCNRRIREPRHLTVACADAGITVTHLTYRHWGPRGAVGHGVLNVNDCKPNCASGHFHHYPAAVAFTDPVVRQGHRVFRVLKLRFGAKHPKAHLTARYVLTTRPF
ncbi:MAG: hypothetical protein ACRDP1_03190 [Nocardioidaceae bacterium]